MLIDPNEGLIDAKKLAKRTGLAVSWIYERTRPGYKGEERIPYYRAGKYVRFRYEEVLTWLKRNAAT